MLEVANLAAAAGLAVAALPIVVHLVSRRRLRRLDFGAVRFLQDALARRRSRLALDRWLLLAIRTLLLVCVALALLRLQWLPAPAAAADRIVREGRVSAVVLIDDSPSTATPGAMDAIKSLALAYLDTLADGDAVSIVPVSQAKALAGDPLYDLEAARALVRAVKPGDVSIGAAAAIEAGMAHLARHLNPHAELVLASDGRADAWRAGEEAWGPLRRRLGGSGERLGSRSRPHLVLLAPEAGRGLNKGTGNCAIDALAIGLSPLPAQRIAPIRIGLLQSGGSVAVQALLRVQVDGRSIDERRVELLPDLGSEVLVHHAFAAGEHLVEARLLGHHDEMPGDDARWVVANSEERLPVLLVEGRSGRGPDDLDGSLGTLAAALAAGSGESFFQPRRVSVQAFTEPGRAESLLAGLRVVVLGDVPALDAASVAVLERFVAAGGGILVVAGPASDAGHLSRSWWRNGDGFLPCAVGDARGDLAGPGQIVASAGLAHPVLGAFTGPAAETWREVRVKRLLGLPAAGSAGAPVDLERILNLADGSPLLVARARGQGRVILLASSLDGAWGDLPWRPACVPLLRACVGWMAARSSPPRSLRPGDEVLWLGETFVEGAALSGPAEASLPLRAGNWEGLRCLAGGPLPTAGPWTARAAGRQALFACNLDATESALLPVDERRISEALQGRERHRRAHADAVPGLFGAGQGTSRELWRILLGLAIALLLIEGCYTRRVVGRERAHAEGA